MSEQTSRKKVVSRTVAIGLGIVCIILLGGLVGAILVYSPMISQVAELTSIANLTKSTIWVDNETVNIQGNNQYTDSIIWNFSANYAGYASVHVFSNATVSNPNAPVGISHTYVHVIYSSHGVYYHNYLYIYGADETVVFPVLPTSMIRVGIGNIRAETLTDTITITYHY